LILYLTFNELFNHRGRNKRIELAWRKGRKNQNDGHQALFSWVTKL